MLPLLLLGVSSVAWGADSAAHAQNGANHADPFAPVVLGLAFVITIAMVGHGLAGRFRQPPVLGELMIGVIIGNVGYWLDNPLAILVMHLDDARAVFREIWRSGEAVSHVAEQVLGQASFEANGVGTQLREITSGAEGMPLVYIGFALSLFSALGVLLLTFMVGLQSTVTEMARVGIQAGRVAGIGILIPFALGMAVSQWMLPAAGTPTHLFVAATLTLCATSVGITARVLMDMGRIQTSEARVILGAAVIDDVLGLVLLALVAGIAPTGHVAPQEVARISLLSLLFLGSVILFGERIARAAARIFDYMDRQQGKLLFPIALAFALSWLADAIHLASIVGAFAAGLIVSDDYFHKEKDGVTIEDLVFPLESIFAPVFFVLIGMQVNLSVFAEPSTLLLAAGFTVAAVIGKLVSGAVAGRGVDRLTVGIGMIPRGEVGLIFASIGKALGVVDDTVFSAIVVMVMLTTFGTPIALHWSMKRKQRAHGSTESM
jgi:Kef-type K+ transport system membrane component KefB